MQWYEPRATGWEARTLPLSYATPYRCCFFKENGLRRFCFSKLAVLQKSVVERYLESVKSRSSPASMQTRLRSMDLGSSFAWIRRKLETAGPRKVSVRQKWWTLSQRRLSQMIYVDMNTWISPWGGVGWCGGSRVTLGAAFERELKRKPNDPRFALGQGNLKKRGRWTSMFRNSWFGNSWL